MFDADPGLKKGSLLKEVTGKRCTVFSHHNQFLFLGKLSSHGDHQDHLVLERYDGDEMEGFLVASTPLKLHVPLNNDTLGVVEGQVSQWSREFLVLDVFTAVKKNESRAYFRQNVGQAGSVEWVNGEKTGHRCTVVDISATGVAITCRQDYEVGDLLEFSHQRFRPGGPEHQLKCRVARKGPTQEDLRFYGCQWVELSPKAEEKLFQEVFAIQAAELQKKRGR